jgi:hypothetical protein
MTLPESISKYLHSFSVVAKVNKSIYVLHLECLEYAGKDDFRCCRNSRTINRMRMQLKDYHSRLVVSVN